MVGKKCRGTIYSIWSSAHNAGAFACVAVVQLASFLFTGSIAAVFTLLQSSHLRSRPLSCGRRRTVTATVGLPSIAEYTGDEVKLDNGESSATDLTDLSLQQVFITYILKKSARLGDHIDINGFILSSLWDHELDPKLFGPVQRLFRSFC